MTGFKTFSANVRRRLLVASGALVLLAALVYGLTLADYVFPGESARLVTQWTGMDALAFPEHPIWGRLVSLMAGLSFTASTALRIILGMSINPHFPARNCATAHSFAAL